MGSNIPMVSLSSSNVNIPLVGLGTAVWPFPGPEAIKEAVLNAIELGYRHFDSAAAYYSEKPLGDAIAGALSRGLINSRGELFITSKLWCCDAHYDRVLPGLQLSLRNLGLEYLDLYLIHWPVSSKEPGEYSFPIKEGNLVPMDFKSTWEAMEECQKLGLTKSIGVSNFSCKKLSDLLLEAKIPPAINQDVVLEGGNEPALATAEAEGLLRIKGHSCHCLLSSGAKGTTWGGSHVMECEALKQIAEARGKTVAQVALRWVYEQGVIMVVKSFNKERMKENLEIFDWELTQEESKKINEIPQHKGLPGR
ncbi:non-functional NADPH-dependent codeinone reductase 2 [Cinnamomum micranthum f. kanehirae]|uniref:Non-functional NADPH-dependent codeinone reductase 2 n=1 Tax=Cinnamomum micranthum f. kanehirae TaxID=337451 RepID=A0A443NLZ6_9MAGN|nr:non-functional NADPH-dependent codeinone reductase 2 [Cinnamomum micranthum f. kanehirae]